MLPDPARPVGEPQATGTGSARRSATPRSLAARTDSKVLVESGLAQRDFGTSIRNNALLRARGGAVADRAVAVPRRAGELGGCRARPRVLPHRVLLPVGDAARSRSPRSSSSCSPPPGRQRGARLARHQRTQLVRRPARCAAPHRSAPVGVDGSGAAAAARTARPHAGGTGSLGPSVAMCVLIVLAVFTTSGTFMLLFLAALQNVGAEVEEAHGRTASAAVPQLLLGDAADAEAHLFTVLTLGLIGTWQVFDQIYLTGRGAPAKTLLARVPRVRHLVLRPQVGPGVRPSRSSCSASSWSSRSSSGGCCGIATSAGRASAARYGPSRDCSVTPPPSRRTPHLWRPRGEGGRR